MTELRKRAIDLMMDCLDATDLNRNRLASLAGVWTGSVYNAANGCTASEYTIGRVKDVLYARLVSRREELEKELSSVSALMARIERDELRGMCRLGDQGHDR